MQLNTKQIKKEDRIFLRILEAARHFFRFAYSASIPASSFLTCLAFLRPTIWFSRPVLILLIIFPVSKWG